jgi:hypothetical protein
MYGGGWKPTDAHGYREHQGQPAAGWAERADRVAPCPGRWDIVRLPTVRLRAGCSGAFQ